MTRINVVDPVQLTDIHLAAEVRELPMIMGSLRRSLRSKNGLPKIPPKYTLNKGHVSFHYDKGLYLHKRYLALHAELTKRGYKLMAPEARTDYNVFIDNGLYNDWTPTEEALAINQERITERILAKPDWYRYCGKSITKTDMFEILVRPNKLWIPDQQIG